MSSYSELLKDPRWQRKRLEILNRADFKCEECMDGTSTLHVHHKIYRKGAKPWEYEHTELAALCEGCHEDRHKWKEKLLEAIGSLNVYDLARVLGYAQAHLVLGDLAGKTMLKLEGIEHAQGISDALHVGVEFAHEVVNGRTSDDQVSSSYLFDVLEERARSRKTPKTQERCD